MTEATDEATGKVVEFNASLKKVTKGDKSPQLVLDIIGKQATHHAAALMELTPGQVTIRVESHQTEIPVETEVDEGQTVIETTGTVDGEEARIVSDPPDNAKAEAAAGLVEEASREIIAEGDDEVPFTEGTEDVDDDAAQDLGPEDVEAMLDDDGAEAAEGDDPDFIHPDKAYAMMENVLVLDKGQHVREMVDGIRYTLVMAGEESDIYKLTVGDAPNDDFAIAAALRFFDPAPHGAVGMDKAKRTFTVKTQVYKQAVTDAQVATQEAEPVATTTADPML